MGQWDVATTLLLASSRRPRAVRQALLLPFDPDDPHGGLVHTTLPPEQVIPSRPTRFWFNGDFSGVMLKETPPYVPGANTTPREMVMSFLLDEYDQAWKDKILTAHAERGYWAFHGPGVDANNVLPPAQDLFDLHQYIQSWGFLSSCWVAAPVRDGNWNAWRPHVEPFLRLAANNSTFADHFSVVLGKELDGFNRPAPDGLDDIIRGVCAICNPAGIPVWLHFNANKPSWYWGEEIAWIRQWVGKVTGLAWQGNPYDSAGALSAHLWDSRVRWAAADPSFHVSAFEYRGTAKLYGKCDETGGCRAGWELICATRTPGSSVPPVAGACDGLGRYPDGRPLWDGAVV